MNGLQMVIDSNVLQNESLREFLSKSRTNIAVVTDYAAMEAYKGDTLRSIFPAMEILSCHPKQVVILKGTQAICAASGRSSGLRRRLVDQRQTREFSSYCRDLRSGLNGEPSFRKNAVDLGISATSHLDDVLAGTLNLPEIIDRISATYPQDELKSIRVGAPLNETMQRRLLFDCCQMAASMFKDHPLPIRRPTAAELPNTFIFRFAVCVNFLALRWIFFGGIGATKPEKLRNDLVDITFSTYATFFDGLLTFEKRLIDLHRQASSFIRSIRS